MRTLALLLAICFVPTSSAILIGVDATGDSINDIAAGQSAGALISEARTDIVGLDIEDEGKTLTVRLDLGVAPSGTSGYMYRVIFDVGGSEYFTCWNVQWTGNQDAQENVLGCSRFLSGTQVGPDLTSDGVAVGSADITWPVGKSELGIDSLQDIASVHAETWFRGISTCCPGSTQHSQYLWNRADRGPDTDVWLIPVAVPAAPTGVVGGIAPPVSFVLLADLINITGSNATVPVTIVSANLTAPLTIDLEVDAPTSVNVTVPANITVSPESPNATFEVLAEALFSGNETATFVLHATGGNHTASLTFTLTGDAAGIDAADAFAGDSAQESPALPVLIPLLAAFAFALRRRR